MDLTVIVPLFNEERTVAQVLNELLKVDFEKLDWEVILVDDGSTDKTQEVIKPFLDNRRIKLITHQTNLGKGMALKTGLAEAKGGIIAFQDSDMEYSPSQLPMLLKPILNGENVVYGSRFLGSIKGMKPLFYIGNKTLSLATRLMYNAKITDMETGFKVFRREVIDSLNLESNGFDIEPEITAKVLKKGYNILELPIDYVGREKKHKKITVRDGIRALFVLIKYRVK